jgi:long-chain acyl-CoA synthetase
MGNGSSTIVTSMSVEVQPPTENSSGVYRHRHYPDRLVEIPFEDEPEINSVYKMWARACERYSGNNLFGVRELLANGSRGDYVWETYGQIAPQVDRIGSALAKLGLNANDTVGIFSINRPEWMKAFLGLQRTGCICVPLYDTLGADATCFILGDAGVKVAFTSNDHLDALLECLKSDIPLKTIVAFDAVSEEDVNKVMEAGARLISLADLEATGTDTTAPANRNLDDLVYYMYTSGTTGNPKGVKITNRNLLSNVAALKSIGIQLMADDVYFSYLPLAHCFEACLQLLGLAFGALVGFY